MRYWTKEKDVYIEWNLERMADDASSKSYIMFYMRATCIRPLKICISTACAVRLYFGIFLFLVLLQRHKGSQCNK